MASLRDLTKSYSKSYSEQKLPDLENFYKEVQERLILYRKKQEESLGYNNSVFTGWVYGDPIPDLTSSVITDPNSYKGYADQNLWVSDMTAAYKRYGLNDNAIKNLIAKNALESTWGKSVAGNFNFGNITAGKYWKGSIVEAKDKDKNGNVIINKFRSYNTLDDFVKDEIEFLTKLYDFNPNDSINVFLDKLLGNNKGKRQYAEDPRYKTKVLSVYNKL